MELKIYLKLKWGTAARLARELGVTSVQISNWAAGLRPVPEARAPAIEYRTEFNVPVETLCPHTRWRRVADPSWPLGKPLIDKVPAVPRTKAAPPSTPNPFLARPARRRSRRASQPESV